MRIAVIGGGIFGGMTALRLAHRGPSISLYERANELLAGASYNNQNRLHLGFHYPRDDLTVRQCRRGFDEFVGEFPEAIRENFSNAYFIAREGSLTSPDAFLNFCRRHDLEHSIISIPEFRPEIREVALGVMTNETVYDSRCVRHSLKYRLKLSDVDVRTNCEVVNIDRVGSSFCVSDCNGGMEIFDAIVNCCYSDLDRINFLLGHYSPKRLFEYTALPIIEVPNQEAFGVTILDGEFLTILPFGHSDKFLLYHVAEVVIERCVADFLPDRWRHVDTAPFAEVDRMAWFRRMIDRCSKYAPVLQSARLIDVLQGPRMVLAKVERTDARPSLVTLHEPGYVSVFSGKVDHAMWVHNDVWDRLADRLT